MIELTKISNIYFIGIGGIGMSALARYFNSHGVKVSGYDKTETVLTKQLSAEGVDIHFEDNINLIDKAAQLVVFTPAVPKEHHELNFYQNNHYTVVKRSDVLGAITNQAFNVCVAGTHGKTTTSTMVAHILRDSGFGSNAFLGGISVNYNTNFWSSEKNVCVVEADEYDRSFLKLSPDIAIITSMDPDHLDIYGTPENVEQGFIDFSSKIKPGGTLISKFGLARSKELKGTHHLSYHVDNPNADVYAKNISTKNGSYTFDVVCQEWTLSKVTLNMGGIHNIENVLAAIAVAHTLKIKDEKIKDAVATFKGVKRRFEYILKTDDFVLIDDYAHHPEELRALITGAKSLFADKKCTIVFQPHLFTRTRDLADEFAETLSLADEIILLPIYPARELPIQGVTSEMILQKMKNKNATVKSKDELLKWINEISILKTEKTNLTLMMAGAGDIDTLVLPVKEMMSNGL